MNKKPFLELNQSFNSLKDRIINSTIIVMIIIAFPLIIASISKAMVTGWKANYALQIALFSMGVLLLIFRKKLLPGFKAWILNALFISIGILGFLTFGILGNGNLYFVVAVLFTGLFIGKKESYYMLVFISVILVLFAVLYTTGQLTHDKFDLEEYASHPTVWISFSLVLIIVIAGMLVIDNSYIDFFIRSDKKLREQQERIERSEQNYREIFNATSEAIFIHNAKNGEVENVNDTMLKMFRCTKERVLGQTVDKFSSNIGPYNEEGTKEKMQKALTEGTQTFEWQSRKETGEVFWSEVSLRHSNIGGEDKVIAVVRDINERKLLEEQTKLFKETIDIYSDAAYWINMEGRFVYINLMGCRSLGYLKEELLQMKISDVNPAVNERRWKEVWETIKKTGTLTSESIYRRKDGSTFPVETISTYIKAGSRELVNSFARDITDRKRYEYELKESEQRFRFLIENILVVTWVINQKGITDYVSPNIEHICGYTSEEIIGEGEAFWFERIHPDDINKVKTQYAEIFSDDGEFNLEYRIKRKDGQWIWLSSKANVFQDIEGVKYAYGVFADITREKDAEMEILQKNQELIAIQEELRTLLGTLEDTNTQLEEKNEELNEAIVKIEESEIKYHALFDNANDSIFLMKEDKFIECNKKALDMFNIEKDDIINRSPVEFSPKIQPDGRSSIEKAIEKNKDAYNGIPQFFEWKLKRYDGRLFDVEVSLNVLYFQNERYLQAIVRDITERKMAEAELRESEKKFRNIFQSSIDGIIIMDLEFNILNVNQRTLEFIGYTLEELKKKKITDYIAPDNLPVIIKRQSLLKQGISLPPIEIYFMHSNGKLLPIEISSNFIVYEEQQAVLTIVRDISERKQIEKKILSTIINTEEKEKNRFARELHDGLGPILSTVKLYYQWLSETADPEKKQVILEKGSEIIEEAITTLREISTNLSPHILNDFGFYYAIEQFVEKLAASKKVKFHVDINCNDRFEKEVEITLYRIVTELINNTLKHSKATDVFIAFKKEKENEEILLSYRDNGKGFDLDSIKKSNAGLGLFNMENRIKTIGGRFELTSKINKGMAVTISIKL